MRYALLISMALAGCSSLPESPLPAPLPEEKPSVAIADEFSTATLHTCPSSVGGWSVVSSLSVEIRGGKLFFKTDKPELWPNIDGCIGHVHCILFRNGAWHAGPIDGIRPFQQNGGDRSVKIAAVPEGDQILYSAVSGEKVGFVVSGFCRYGARMKPAQRTGIAWVVWP